jgi:ATP/maltotriose-dependent transcriptional regulator MalT
MEQLPLLQTKLHSPPVRSALVSRPHLLERLDAVKAHPRNIYGKLRVHNRTGAVARARSLGLFALTNVRWRRAAKSLMPWTRAIVLPARE